MEKRSVKRKSNRRRAARVPRATPRFYWLPITEEKIRQAAQKIVDAVQPEKIILFGSFAYGKPDDDSDVDLFVVLESDQRIRERAMQLSEVLYPRPFPVDIITRTPAELKERLEIGDCFFKEIVSKGKVLYERVTPLKPGSRKPRAITSARLTSSNVERIQCRM